MSENIKVSVIITVYNREKYLVQCIESVLAQKLHDIEVILVDDGSTDNSSSICDDYAKRDSRIRVVHQENSGSPGAAHNKGIMLAEGEYIGFVDADDWIEPNMYMDLYEHAKKFDVDVVKSLFTQVKDDKVLRVVNQYKQGIQPYYRRIEKVLTDVPALAYGHYSPWSAIYRRTFVLNSGAKFAETTHDDILFHWMVYTQVQSCCIIPKSYYNYRIDNPSSAVNQGYRSAENSLRTFALALSFLVENRFDQNYIELFALALFKSARHHNVHNCKGLGKLRHSCDVAKTLAVFMSRIKFKYFQTSERKIFKLWARHPIIFYFQQLIYKKEFTSSGSRHKFFGVTVTKTNIQRDCATKYCMGIPYASQKRCGDITISRFMGLRYNTRQISLPFESDVRMLQTIAHANAIAQTHQKTFAKYKNCHKDDEIVLIATGNTLKYFTPDYLKNRVYVGLNTAVARANLPINYFFFQDFRHPQAQKILRCVENRTDVKKFYGILQDVIFADWIIPESVALRHEAERYYVISQWKYPPVHFTYDIANEPLGDSGAVCFAAMQFILWTNPRRIYLVGVDVTDRYFDNSLATTSKYGIGQQYQGWMEMLKFAKAYYPDTEIVSINPVRLRGMCNDVYTENFISNHPEIKDYTLLKDYLNQS